MACDCEKIERAILSLLSNTIKFTKSGGKIEASISNDDNEITISVKDSGIGMPKEKIKDIFDRFAQVDKSLTRKHEGSGIGLSLVKSIVEMHYGSIDVKSKVNEGSEFIIKLPLTVTSGRITCQEEIAATCSTNVERICIEFSDIYS